MQSRFGAYLLIALVAAPITAASAGHLPDIKSSPQNAVPECVTPGRLLAFLKSRNPSLDHRFDGLPSEYMRYGEALGVRWDYAFYQMILETGALTFRNGSRTGDVKPTQNNFAGLGATGKGEPGESFPDVATGVRAHLEHLLLYAGDRLESPVAERTRKVQQWGVLTAWQASFKKPISFSDLAHKWAPGSNSYGKMLESLSQNFQDFCRRPDPKPELAAAVRNSRNQIAALMPPPEQRPDGSALARRALDEGKAEENNRRSGLGAQEQAAVPASNTKAPPTPFKILNAPPSEEPADTPPPAARQQAQAPTPPPAANNPAFRSGMLNMPGKQLPPAAAPEPPVETPSAPPAAQQPVHQVTNTAPNPPPAARKEQRVAMVTPPPSSKPVAVADAVPPGQKCRVWTASYGGQKALIIRSIIDKVVNFTVLDVNEGSERREADAFIAAYAKNGAVAGEFQSQNTALDKAFELCPEG